MMTLAPGDSTGDKAEAHEKSDQVLLMLDGELTGEVGDEHPTLKKGDVIIIPVGVLSRFASGCISSGSGGLSDKSGVTRKTFSARSNIKTGRPPAILSPAIIKINGATIARAFSNGCAKASDTCVAFKSTPPIRSCGLSAAALNGQAKSPSTATKAKLWPYSKNASIRWPRRSNSSGVAFLPNLGIGSLFGSATPPLKFRLRAIDRESFRG
jgi:Cupin domain